MALKIICVVTNHDQLGSSGNKTGWYLPEVAHPYEVLTKAGFQVTFVSPKGGKAPMDPGSGEAFKDDPICQAFLKNDVKKLDSTLKPSDVKPGEYKALFYAGGHGPMFDLPNNEEIAKLAGAIYENGGVLSAVCHGTVGFLPIKLSSGEPLLKGQTVTSFTDAEEAAVNLVEQMPFLLETELKKNGATFTSADNFKPHVVVSGRLVTGQNPASATPMAEKLVEVIKKA